MPYSSDKKITDLVNEFENSTLPKALWTHQAHQVVALYYLYNQNFYEALCLIRSKIIRYNNAVGTFNSPSSGYHETLTIFWLIIIHDFLKDKRNLALHDSAGLFLKSPRSSKELPLSYYSKETLFSTRARAMWITPENGILKFPETH